VAKKTGRKPIGKKAMTGAERQRRRRIKFGEQTIKATVYFNTVGLEPGNCWADGIVHLRINDPHGIKLDNGLRFRARDEIGDVVLAIMKKANVTIHPSAKEMKRE